MFAMGGENLGVAADGDLDVTEAGFVHCGVEAELVCGEAEEASAN